MIDLELKKYIEENIFPKYSKNDLGHALDHIKYVLNRSLKFAQGINDININMVYVIAAYHDIGHYIDKDRHEEISGLMLSQDENLKKWFNDEEIKIMMEAVIDHRASLEYEPRSIYGKIVSSADRSLKIDDSLKRTYAYRTKDINKYCLTEIIKGSKEHLIDKFGKEGYANEKMYFDDIEYKQFLDGITKLVQNEDLFIKKYIEVNNIDKNLYRIIFENVKKNNPNMLLEELLYETYIRTRINENDKFDEYRDLILEVNDISI